MYRVNITAQTRTAITDVYKKNTFPFFETDLLKKSKQKIKGRISVK
jgi:hypothetical protein